MFEPLLSKQGKSVVVELSNGRKITGKVLAVDQQFIRIETDEGIGTIPLYAIYIVWDSLTRSIAGKHMEEIAGQLREDLKAQIACTGAQFSCRQTYICRPPDVCTGFFACPGSYVPFQGGSQCPATYTCSAGFYGFVGPDSGMNMGQQGQEDVKAEISCTAFPGFTCARQYICRPPDNCTFSFACPGNYVPGFPQGGGCPLFFCAPFQFGQPCGPFQFGQPCGPFQFGQPCVRFPFTPPCGPFQFGQPCGPFQFNPPCRPFQFQQPCGPFQFGQPCPTFPFGSQCGAPGGFICPGMQFVGVAGPGGPGQGPATGQMPGEKLPPATLAVDSVNKDAKEEKE
ncbi:MAG: hypothetical protein K6T80_03435 [Firmicutes bacterium]|nr:hypothetical protein [Bacillota bacterium]